MKVSVKKFDVAMDLKNNGIEMDVSDNSDAHIGDLVVNKVRLIWCKGRVGRTNGIAITWDAFIKYMETPPGTHIVR